MGDVGVGSTTAQRSHRRRWVSVAVVAALGIGVGLFLFLRSGEPASTPLGGTDGTASAWPNRASTGVPAGTALTASGPLTLSEDGQTVEGLDVDGPIVVDASDVVIRNSRVHGSAPTGILVRGGSVRIERTEISGFANAISGDNWTATAVDIHGVTDDGVKLGNNVSLTDSWLHDFTPAADAHSDGVQMQSGLSNVRITGNDIDLSTAPEANAAIFLSPDLGPSSDGPITVENNRLNGGNYTLYCVDGANGTYVVGGISILGNQFGRTARYGPSRINVPITQADNHWADTGEPLVL